MSDRNKDRKKALQALKEKGRKSVQSRGDVAGIVIDDFYANAANSLIQKKLRTGLIFSKHSDKHYCIWDESYPECPARTQVILNALQEYGLLDRCLIIQDRPTPIHNLEQVHSMQMIGELLVTRFREDDKYFEKLSSDYDAIFINRNTSMAALLAAGCTVDLVNAILNGDIQNGMAIVRPPGHHANRSKHSGYCFYNNVAVAAQYALDHYNLKRILIVDFDVHHGNGTQEIFFCERRILYISIHRYESGEFWPNLKSGNFNYIGAYTGRGFNINVPLNCTNCNDTDYLQIFHTLLLPVAYEFNPQLVLVSAGYDAACGDPEGEMNVTPSCYHHLITSLLGLAGGKVAVILEGGYFLPSLQESAAQTVRALLGDPAPQLPRHDVPNDIVRKTLLDCISIHRFYWNSLDYFSYNSNEENVPSHTVEMKYTYTDGKPKPPYPTRNCYPVLDDTTVQHFEKIVQDLRRDYYSRQTPNVVGYTYDVAMELHKCPDNTALEKPDRIIKTLEILRKMNVLSRLQYYEARHITTQELTKFHDKKYVDMISRAKSCSIEECRKKGWVTTYTNPHTYNSATAAAGALSELTSKVLDGSISSGIAIIRPPGHHAEKDMAGGFCIFNNIVLAAKQAQQQCCRVLIVDFDVHHGNGIQRAFYDNKNVMYMSIHRYHNGTFYPKSTDGDYNKIGEGNGLGYNVNIAWNAAPMKDADYMHAFFNVILPIAYAFQPNFTIVAAGFDACKGDPIGGCHVTPEAYGHFIQLLKPISGGKMIIALEGGYNSTSVGYSMTMCAKALLGDPLPALQAIGKPSDAAIKAVQNTISVLQPIWKVCTQNTLFTYAAVEVSNEQKPETEEAAPSSSSSKPGTSTDEATSSYYKQDDPVLERDIKRAIKKAVIAKFLAYE